MSNCNHNWGGLFPSCHYCGRKPVECPACERPLHGEGICIDEDKVHVIKELIIIPEGDVVVHDDSCPGCLGLEVEA